MMHRSSGTHAPSKRLGGRAGGAVIVIKKLVDDRRYQTGSARERCFEVIEDGISLSEYLAAARRKRIPRDLAMGCLNKLTAQGQAAKARVRTAGGRKH